MNYLLPNPISLDRPLGRTGHFSEHPDHSFGYDVSRAIDVSESRGRSDRCETRRLILSFEDGCRIIVEAVSRDLPGTHVGTGSEDVSSDLLAHGDWVPILTLLLPVTVIV